MVLVLVVLHRRDEVKRWTFLTERRRRSRRGFVREVMEAWGRCDGG